MINQEAYCVLKKELAATNTDLVAVSKFKSVEDINGLYQLGQKDFGENYVQELVSKNTHFESQGVNDMRWHFIGHLQKNKVKYIASFVHLIHGVDSIKLLAEINKQGAKNNRTIDCLLQIHIATEETKFGLDEKEAFEVLEYYTAQPESYANVRIRGLMGMASFTENKEQIKHEFHKLQSLFVLLQKSFFLTENSFNTISAGMTNDYSLAIQEGSNMVRIGSLLFGKRD